jgi:hypothetical protein
VEEKCVRELWKEGVEKSCEESCGEGAKVFYSEADGGLQ